jgi:hypothetical protein
MTAQQIFEIYTGEQKPTNFVALYEYNDHYKEWLEKQVEMLFKMLFGKLDLTADEVKQILTNMQ